jgi:autotransporter family porin
LTEGTAAHGALSRDNPTSVTMNFTSVLATGSLAHGSVAQEGGLIIGNNTTVKATGTLGSALFLLGTPTGCFQGDLHQQYVDEKHWSDYRYRRLW